MTQEALDIRTEVSKKCAKAIADHMRGKYGEAPKYLYLGYDDLVKLRIENPYVYVPQMSTQSEKEYFQRCEIVQVRVENHISVG